MSPNELVQQYRRDIARRQQARALLVHEEWERRHQRSLDWESRIIGGFAIFVGLLFAVVLLVSVFAFVREVLS